MSFWPLLSTCPSDPGTQSKEAVIKTQICELEVLGGADMVVCFTSTMPKQFLVSVLMLLLFGQVLACNSSAFHQNVLANEPFLKTPGCSI